MANEKNNGKWVQAFRNAPVGMLILVGAILWALIEFIVSVCYFF